VNVKLPAPDAACEGNRAAAPEKVSCDYAEDVLMKIANQRLKDDAPDAYAMLKKMSLTNKDQISMIAAVEVGKKTPAEAAKAWVAANESVWKAWLAK
jgi:glycine betaine/proline transport system substrate-binding protein